MQNGRRMRIVTAVIFAFSLFTPRRAYAQAAPALSAHAAMVQVGVAAAVSGTVRISSGPAVGTLLESGRPIYLGDVITTDAGSRLQVMLLDETVFTVGPSSSVVIDEFVYDPATHDGKVTAQVLKGAFRFVTGKIAHKKPENMKVTLPSGTIGVRGTMVAGRVDGGSSLVALLGPGPNNNAGARIGKIEVANPVDGQLATVLVTQPGFGTTIPGINMPPTPPAMLPPQVMDALQHDLSGPIAPPAQAPAGTEPAAHDPAAPNQPQADDEDKPRSDGPQGPHRPDGQRPARENGPRGHRPGPYAAGMPPMPPPPGATFGTFDPYAAVNNTYQQTTTAAQTTTTIASGIAKKEHLAQIQGGSFHFNRVGLFRQLRKDGVTLTAPIDGTMQVKLNIDFGSRTVGGGLSGVIVNTTANGGNIAATMGIAPQSFTGFGDAVFTQTNTLDTLKIDYAIKNVNGGIGNGMDAHVLYNSTPVTGTSTSNAGEGQFINVPRQDGLLQ